MLSKEILSKKPRETSGSKVSRKYNFQKDLSLFILIERHYKLSDYTIIFDLFDDLVILNSSQDPTEIEFFQVKSKDKGNWTLNALLKKEKAKLSILSKLYYNRLLFENNTKSLNFISNAPFSFQKLTGNKDSKTKTHINSRELDVADYKYCIAQIQQELNLPKDPQINGILNFLVTTLNNKDSATHCTGALAQLIHHLNPNSKVNISLAYSQIFREIDRKTNTDVTELYFEEFSEMIEQKGITRNDFEAFLESAGLYKSSEQVWSEINTILTNEGVNWSELIRLKNAWRGMECTLLKEKSNRPLMQLRNNIKACINELLSAGDLKEINFFEFVTTILSKIKSEAFQDKYFIKCLIIKEIYEEYK